MGICCGKEVKTKLKVLSPNRRPTSHRFISKHFSIQLSQGTLPESYKIIQNLGQNSQCLLKLALYKNTSSTRAIKQISNTFKLDTSRLIDELNILKALDHPNIIKIYELVQDSEFLNIVMEHCTGGELFDKIKLDKDLSENSVANYMLDAISAIKYCHEAKIVHRDLKPENMLFENQNKDARLKILDFGTSQSYRNCKKIEGFIGSYYYIAPEVIDKEYSDKCDVWSLGVILYIMLCGYPPFYAKTTSEICEKIKKVQVSFKGAVWDNISEEAKTLIQKMLRKDPNTRYSIYDVYSDPWIQNRAHNRIPDKALSPEAKENLKRFSTNTRLQKIVSAYMTKQSLTKTQLDNLKRKFESLDPHNENKLTVIEIQFVCNEICLDLDLSYSSLISKCNQEIEGIINYTEFIEKAVKTEKLISLSRFLQSLNELEGFVQMSKLELLSIIQETGISEPDLSDLLDVVENFKESQKISGLVEKNNRV